MQQQIITIAPLPVSEKKTRAAAYVRVSTNKDDQLNSFAAQYIHYKKLLEESISEELVDVYADATVIIGLKQNPTHGRRFSPIFFA